MLSMLLIYLNSAFCLWVFVPYCITAVLRGGGVRSHKRYVTPPQVQSPVLS